MTNVPPKICEFRNYNKDCSNQKDKENLAFAIRASEDAKKNVKNRFEVFPNIAGDRSLNLSLPKGYPAVRILLTHELPWVKLP